VVFSLWLSLFILSGVISPLFSSSILGTYQPENPINNMKRQKDMTLKDGLPRLVGAQYAAGEQWRNNSRKNEEAEPK